MNKNIGKNLYIVILASCIFAVCGVACSKSENDKPKREYPNRYYNMTPLDLTIIDPPSLPTITYRIPKGYLSGRRKGGEVKGMLTIETGLPDLLPRPGKTEIVGIKGSKEYEESLIKYNNGIFINLKGNKLTDTFYDNYRRMHQRDYSQVPSEIESLDKFVKFRKDGSKDDLMSDYFITKVSSENWAFFNCFRDDGYSGCGVTITYHGWEVGYNIRRSQLYRWKEFDVAVRRLLDKFYLTDASK